MEALATITSVRGLVTALAAIRTTQKLPCAVTFDPTGLQLRFLDGGHAMQSGISLSASVFSHFQSPASLSFYVPLSVLLDSVNSVASSAPQELQLQYPGPGNSLLLTATEDASARTSICSYAKIGTLAQQDMSSLDDMWDPADPCSHAILSGMLLREAVEDLEWTGGEVEFVMRRSPARFSLQSIKQQSLEISFPPHVLDGFSCHAEEVRATFKYKHLKAAFTNVAQREQWSAKISISSRGVLKVTHMLTLAGGSAMAVEAPHPLGTFSTQNNADRTCVAQFIIMPHDEEGDATGFAGEDD